MRFGARMMLWACCAGPAVAAMLVTGSGQANAAPLTPVVSSGASFGPHGGGPWGGHGPGQPNCDRRQLERWDVNGTNTVNVVYSSGTATYGVTFRQDGECLGGTLTDPNIPNGPKTGPIFGTVDGNTITFSFKYTYTGANQGTRTFTGTINRFGSVSGTWNETGTEGLSGTWSLASRVDRACSWRVLRWRPWRECAVHAHP
jgi:hypothetical protein